MPSIPQSWITWIRHSVELPRSLSHERMNEIGSLIIPPWHWNRFSLWFWIWRREFLQSFPYFRNIYLRSIVLEISSRISVVTFVFFKFLRAHHHANRRASARFSMCKCAHAHIISGCVQRFSMCIWAMQNVPFGVRTKNCSWNYFFFALFGVRINKKTMQVFLPRQISKQTGVKPNVPSRHAI